MLLGFFLLQILFFIMTLWFFLASSRIVFKV